MTNEDPRVDDADDTDDAGSDQEAGDAAADRPHEDAPESSTSGEEGPEDAAADRSQRPLLAGVIGLIAGTAGGIAGTMIAPNSLVLTIVLVIGVAGIVTLAVLRLLGRRA